MMREIVIKTGVYGRRLSAGRVQPVAKGERVTLPDEEAARLVSLGVAAYADVSVQDTPAVPTVPAPMPETDGADDPDGIARLERMSKNDLEQMARDLGVDISAAKNKHELAVLIAAADGSGEAAPDMSGDIVL